MLLICCMKLLLIFIEFMLIILNVLEKLHKSKQLLAIFRHKTNPHNPAQS